MPVSAWIMFSVAVLILFGGIVVCLFKIKKKK
jgi:hypothetical protein